MKILAIIFLSMTLMAVSCKETGDKEQESTTLKTLYDNYQNGEISRCKNEDQTFFRAARNAFDAGSEIYNEKGEKIGTCYYGTGQVDPICAELEECEVLWRVAKNIWGKEAVNKLNF